MVTSTVKEVQISWNRYKVWWADEQKGFWNSKTWCPTGWTGWSWNLSSSGCQNPRISHFSYTRHLSFWLMKVVQLCPTLCNPLDCSPPGSFVHGILQARILEWVIIPFSSPGTEPRSPALQEDSVPAEPQGKSLLLVKSHLEFCGHLSLCISTMGTLM